MTTHLHASWSDGDAFRENWRPLVDAEEFFLLSCYVSTTGWDELERILSQSASLRRAMLFFSLEGLSGQEITNQIDAVYSLVGKQLKDGPVSAFLILDRCKALFHPKAHASQSGRYSRVVVGSANLTGAGLGSNYELISVIDDNEHVYSQFIDSIERLPPAAQVVSVNATPRDQMLRFAQGRAPLPTAGRSQSSNRDANRQAPIGRFEEVPAPASIQGPFFDLQSRRKAVSPEDALAAVRKLASQGATLVRTDEVEPLTVSTSLARFRKAGVLVPIEIESIAPGITVESRRGVTVSLLPPSVRDRRTELRQTTGRLTGRFSIEVLGIHWTPIDWQGAFLHHWRDVVHALGLLIGDNMRTAIESQLKGMSAELEKGSRLYLSLMKELKILPPREWNTDKARRLLASVLRIEKDEPLPESLSPEQMTDLLAFIWNDVRDHIGRRLQLSYVITQIEQAGLLPRFRRFPGESLDERDALLWLAQWTLSSIGSEVRSPRSSDGKIQHLPNQNGVAQMLAERFGQESNSPPDPPEAYHLALEWKKLAVTDSDESLLESSLAEAWMRFSDWFGVSPVAPLHWASSIPTWSMGEKAG